ncbi:RNA-protein complex protein Nop10 [Candidatus Woesearchaeota archaeon]|nr:RNA-protein complex protein Nop10 [Candidatus Woesearchaeota archaeon]
MVSHIMKCPTCEKYTLQETCQMGHGKTQRPLPPKFSLEDKYGKYRREVKKEELVKKGLY